MGSVKEALHKTNTDIAVKRGELTRVLQPLDVSLNKPFKDRLCEKWSTWMIEGKTSFTAGGNMERACSTKKCSISNAIDGTEEEDLPAFEGSEDEKMEGECDIYDDKLKENQRHDLFRESDEEEEFEGF